MTRRVFQIIAAVTTLTFTSSCALMFYPERKGNNSGPLETLPLLLDILLILPGVIPGVVALVLDFGTGAIYTEKKGNEKPFLTGGGDARRGGAHASRSSSPGGEGALDLQVRVYGSDATVLESRTVTIDADATARHGGNPMALMLEDMEPSEWHVPAVKIEVVAPDGPPIFIPLTPDAGATRG